MAIERAGRRRAVRSRSTSAPWLAIRAAQLWHLLASVRLALVLILILTGLTLVGTLLVQVPAGVADDGEYAWWLDNAVRPRLGIWTTPLRLLGLLDVFHSPWFLGAGALLILNIVVCSVNRLKGTMNAIFSSRIRLANGFYEGGANRAQFLDLEMSPSEACASLRKVLAGAGYRVRCESDGDDMYVAADKNRYFLLATYLHHGSIVLFVLGFLMGSYLGFRDTAFMVPEGSVRDVGHDTGVSLKLESFVDEYWPEGPPKDYRSQVVVYENGVEGQRGTIRVNHPLRYKGLRFFQSFFGPAVVMEVRDQAGRVVYDDGVAQSWLSGEEPYQRPTGRFAIPGTKLVAYVVAPSQGYFDPRIRPGQQRVEVYREGSNIPVGARTLEPGIPAELAGLEFTLVRERQFSGFQVSRDPGNGLIWVGSTLFVVGLVLVFYFPHRQLWARIHTAEGGRTRLPVRTTSARTFAVASNFETLMGELEKELSTGDQNPEGVA